MRDPSRPGPTPPTPGVAATVSAETAPWQATGPFGTSPEPTATRAAVPGHELLSELGRGGMAVVYKARQTALNRVVASKMILAGGRAGPREVARFLAKAQAVAGLHHPNIVMIYEVGEHQGLPFFSLELCSGGSLHARLTGTPQQPAWAAQVVEQMARAVDYAHVRGIVHRDLKPHSALLGEDGVPKITDFGLAKCREGASGLTATGAVMGTPSYMAPEQVSGKTRTVGPATDVYGLGAI